MAAFALLLATSAASLNLCSDEYLLLLARPTEIASISFLSQDPLESPLWRSARRHHANRGSIEQVVALRPTLLLTMGGGGRASAQIARRMDMRTLDLRSAASLEDVEHNLIAVAAALGRPGAAVPWVNRLRALRKGAPAQAVDAIWLSGGGQSLAAGSIGTRWMRLAGFAQRPLSGGHASLEDLLLKPPPYVVASDYRSGQMSGGQRWLDHPIVRKAGRRVRTDGRAWTCMGPLMIGESARLRSLAR
jgi:iron complex transport system substrate-binding protein